MPRRPKDPDDDDLFKWGKQEQEAGKKRVKTHTDMDYLEDWRNLFDQILLTPGFPGICSQMLTGRLGPPRRNGRPGRGTESNAVPALMSGSIRKHGLIKVGSIKSPFDLQTKGRDSRHGHELRIWGYGFQKELFKANEKAWTQNFRAWWSQHFPPDDEPPRPGVKVELEC